MKNYTITVNGNVYDVTVEERFDNLGSSQERIQERNQVPSVFVPNLPVRSKEATISKSDETPIATSAELSGFKIEAGAAGKVIAIEVTKGANVKKGDTLFVLEIMKMETPVTAQKAGIISSICVQVGDIVKQTDTLAIMEEV